MKRLFISLFFIFFTNQFLAINEIDQQLLEAAYDGNLQQIDKFIEAGANVNAQNNGYTALMWAIYWDTVNNNSKEIVHYLLQIPEINIYIKNNEGRTALDMAKIYDEDLYEHNLARLIINSKHFDLDKFLETVPQNQHSKWLDYINKQKEITTEEVLHKLVQKHGSITNYLQQRELARIKSKSLS